MSVDSYTIADKGAFTACSRAEDILNGAGFTVGSLQRGAPCGLMFGEYIISKWRNLSWAERDVLHGELRGDMRNGPVEIVLRTACPAEGKRRLVEAMTARQAA